MDQSETLQPHGVVPKQIKLLFPLFSEGVPFLQQPQDSLNSWKRETHEIRYVDIIHDIRGKLFYSLQMFPWPGAELPGVQWFEAPQTRGQHQGTPNFPIHARRVWTPLQGDARLEESASESGNLWWPQLQSGPGWAVPPKIHRNWSYINFIGLSHRSNDQNIQKPRPAALQKGLGAAESQVVMADGRHWGSVSCVAGNSWNKRSQLSFDEQLFLGTIFWQFCWSLCPVGRRS